jgi:hypothetical protein
MILPDIVPFRLEPAGGSGEVVTGHGGGDRGSGAARHPG